MSRVQTLMPFQGFPDGILHRSSLRNVKDPLPVPQRGNTCCRVRTPSAAAQTCRALPWTRVLSCPRASSARIEPRGKWVRSCVERRGRRRGGSFPRLPSMKVFLTGCARRHAPRAGRCETGCFAGRPQWLCFLSRLVRGLRTLHSSPPPFQFPMGW